MDLETFSSKELTITKGELVHALELNPSQKVEEVTLDGSIGSQKITEKVHFSSPLTSVYEYSDYFSTSSASTQSLSDSFDSSNAVFNGRESNCYDAHAASTGYKHLLTLPTALQQINGMSSIENSYHNAKTVVSDHEIPSEEIQNANRDTYLNNLGMLSEEPFEGVTFPKQNSYDIIQTIINTLINDCCDINTASSNNLALTVNKEDLTTNSSYGTAMSNESIVGIDNLEKINTNCTEFHQERQDLLKETKYVLHDLTDDVDSFIKQATDTRIQENLHDLNDSSAIESIFCPKLTRQTVHHAQTLHAASDIDLGSDIGKKHSELLSEGLNQHVENQDEAGKTVCTDTMEGMFECFEKETGTVLFKEEIQMEMSPEVEHLQSFHQAEFSSSDEAENLNADRNREIDDCNTKVCPLYSQENDSHSKEVSKLSDAKMVEGNTGDIQENMDVISFKTVLTCLETPEQNVPAMEVLEQDNRLPSKYIEVFEKDDIVYDQISVEQIQKDEQGLLVMCKNQNPDLSQSTTDTLVEINREEKQKSVELEISLTERDQIEQSMILKKRKYLEGDQECEVVPKKIKLVNPCRLDILAKSEVQSLYRNQESSSPCFDLQIQPTGTAAKGSTVDDPVLESLNVFAEKLTQKNTESCLDSDSVVPVASVLGTGDEKNDSNDFKNKPTSSQVSLHQNLLCSEDMGDANPISSSPGFISANEFHSQCSQQSSQGFQIGSDCGQDLKDSFRSNNSNLNSPTMSDSTAMEIDQTVPAETEDISEQASMFESITSEDIQPKLYACDVEVYSSTGVPICCTIEDAPQEMEELQSYEKCFKWKYTPSCDIDDVGTVTGNVGEELPTRLQALKSCGKPLRIGLSKRQTVARLHKIVPRQQN